MSFPNIYYPDEFKKTFNKEKSAIIFGGTFDPIHSGHIQDIRSLLKLADTVFIAPTEQNPWKTNPPASLQERIEMIRLALSYEQISFTEDTKNTGLILLNEPYTYAHQVASRLSKLSSHSLFWAIGEDLAATAHTWKNWEQEGVPFVVLPLLQGTSSTKTRNAEIAPHPAISDYIREKNLY